MKFIHIPEWHLTIGAPPKCGSSSVHAALQSEFKCEHLARCFGRVLLQDKSQVTGPLIFVTRAPMDRFKALWRNKCRDHGKITGHRGKLFDLSTDELMDYIEGEAEDNHHWTPQILLLDSLDERCPTDLVPLSRLNAYWHENVPCVTQLSVRNATHGAVDITAALERRIESFYAEDFELHAAAISLNKLERA